jgi:hypothetical protein
MNMLQLPRAGVPVAARGAACARRAAVPAPLRGAASLSARVATQASVRVAAPRRRVVTSAVATPVMPAAAPAPTPQARYTRAAARRSATCLAGPAHNSWPESTFHAGTARAAAGPPA